MFLVIVFVIIALTGWLTALIGTHRRFLHLLQLEDYESGRMLLDTVRYPIRLQLIGWELLGILAILVLSQVSFPYIDHVHAVKPDVFFSGLKVFLILRALDKAWLLAWFIWGAGCLWRAWRMRIKLKSAKKPLVMTTRAKRIFWTSLITSILLAFAAIILVSIIRYNNIYLEFGGAIVSFSIKWAAYFWVSVFVIMYLCERMVPLFLALTVNLLRPVESSVQNRYLKDARRILREASPIVIGITGSYGKTGTKEMLTAMLAEKYSVLCPPGSYNTLMGVTRVIREQLRPYHELFVVEMGAYRIGSIRKLCELVNPEFGIITIVGVQHLERFKTRENIKLAKGELIRALPDDGTAVLNGDDPACREIGAEFKGQVVYFRIDDGISDGLQGEEIADNPSADGRATGTPTVLVKNIRIGIDGTDFDLVFNGDSFPIHLSLLGRSAVSNAAAAAAMADRLGVPRKAIKRALAGMPHVKHRLEPIRREGNITVLDDAFNSNPIGARNALEVLAAAEGGRKILVTPGMIELGPMEDDANREFGRQAASACDLVVLIGGKRVEPIREGLLEEGFSSDNIWVAPSLNAGLERLRSYLKPGDTMLLENDLPDQYDSI